VVIQIDAKVFLVCIGLKSGFYRALIPCQMKGNPGLNDCFSTGCA